MTLEISAPIEVTLNIMELDILNPIRMNIGCPNLKNILLQW